ncbi:MAG: hypothetical protein D8M56_23815 [Chloroflexi bacterium]|nr:hypothetical protein [Chloroflexota bacterium]
MKKCTFSLQLTDRSVHELQHTTDDENGVQKHSFWTPAKLFTKESHGEPKYVISSGAEGEIPNAWSCKSRFEGFLAPSSLEMT